MYENNELFKTSTGHIVQLNDLMLSTLCFSALNEEASMRRINMRLDTFILIPIALLQVLFLFSVIFRIETLEFIIAGTALYAFGYLYRISQYGIVIYAFLTHLTALYNILRWPFYTVIISLVVITQAYHLILPYLGLRVVLYIGFLFAERFIKKITARKYGMRFGSRELCAFHAFYDYADYTNIQKAGYTGLIRVYVNCITNPF